MRDWSTISKETIFKGKDENGNRYLGQFLKDYKERFGGNPSAGCGKCLNDYYKKMITMSANKKENSGYRLKKKYDGISFGFGSNKTLSNRNMTDERAEELIKTHPKGEDLFEKIPTEKVVDSGLGDLSRKELDKVATELGLDPADYKNKDEVSKAIEQAQSNQE